MTDDKETAWNGKYKNQHLQANISGYFINYSPAIKGNLKLPPRTWNDVRNS